MNPRKLKIEAVGDTYYRKAKLRIRLHGDWLDRAGFKAGSHVKVHCVAEGVMEIRSDASAFALNETK